MNTTLTNREFQIVELIAFGLAQKEVANQLHIAQATVDVTVKNAKEKLHLQKATELAAWYFINKYRISLDLSPVTRAMIYLSFLTIVVFALFSGFSAERYQRSGRSSRGRRSETELFTINIAS